MKGARYRFVLIIILLGIVQGFGQSRPQARAGFLDARSWMFQDKRLPLNGYWKMIDSRLAGPDELGSHPSKDYFFPSTWNTSRANEAGEGYATFYLHVLVPDSIRVWAIEIPQLYSSGKLWVNGQEVSTVGKVDTLAQHSVPQWIFDHGTVHAPSDTLLLVFQVSNFQHDKGGIKDPVYLGLPSVIYSNWNWALGTNLAECIILLILGIGFSIFFYFNRKKVIIYFALLCLTWSVRCVFSGIYPVTVFFPDFHWAAQVRIEYLSLYLAIIWATLFLNDLFRTFSSKALTHTLVVLNAFFAVFTLATAPVIFTEWVSLYLAVAGIVVVYGVVLIVRALLSEQPGAWFLLASILTGIVVFGYDIIAYQASFSYNFVFLNIGYLTIFLLTAIALLFQVDVFKSRYRKRNMLTYQDMFGGR